MYEVLYTQCFFVSRIYSIVIFLFIYFCFGQESQKGVGVDLESEIGDRAIFNTYKGLATSSGTGAKFLYYIYVFVY